MKQALYTLATAFIIWAVSTIYNNSVAVQIIENNLNHIYPVLQLHSERG